jgi:hypothetical protein
VEADGKTREVFRCDCGQVGNSSKPSDSAKCIDHGGERLFYAGLGWINVGLPRHTAWLCAFYTLKKQITYDQPVQDVTVAAPRLPVREEWAYRLQLDDHYWCTKSCSCGQPNLVAGVSGKSGCAACGGVRNVAELMIRSARDRQVDRASICRLEGTVRENFLKVMSIDSLVPMLQGEPRCAQCARTLLIARNTSHTRQASLERIDTNGNYESSNCKLFCWYCNCLSGNYFNGTAVFCSIFQELLPEPTAMEKQRLVTFVQYKLNAA